MDVRFENLIREYDGKRVLEIEAGRIRGGSRTAVIGSNGAGKSTLINLIAGLDKPTAGTIYYEGRPRIPRSEITLVFQTPYLISASVEKNIAWPMKLRRQSEVEIETRVSELLTELGLAELRKRKSWKLSGGEVQKVALARALSFRPRLLLLDEPTANIDPATTAEIERMLLKINKEEGTTIVIITHNLAQAKRTCGEALFLNRGKLVEAAPCAELLTSPHEEETRKFVEGELLI